MLRRWAKKKEGRSCTLTRHQGFTDKMQHSRVRMAVKCFLAIYTVCIVKNFSTNDYSSLWCHCLDPLVTDMLKARARETPQTPSSAFPKAIGAKWAQLSDIWRTSQKYRATSTSWTLLQQWDFPNRCTWGPRGLRNRARRTPATSEQADCTHSIMLHVGNKPLTPMIRKSMCFRHFWRKCLHIPEAAHAASSLWYIQASRFLHKRDWGPPIRNGFRGCRLPPKKHRPLSYVTRSTTKMPKVKAALGFVQTYPSKSSHPFELRAASNNGAILLPNKPLETTLFNDSSTPSTRHHVSIASPMFGVFNQKKSADLSRRQEGAHRRIVTVRNVYFVFSASARRRLGRNRGPPLGWSVVLAGNSMAKTGEAAHLRRHGWEMLQKFGGLNGKTPSIINGDIYEPILNCYL